MRSAGDFAPEDLIGKTVCFKTDENHATCWHAQVGLVAGRVLRVSQSLADKARLLGGEGIEVPEALFEDEEVRRLWIKVEPCTAFPRGCEAAVPQDCLLVDV